MAQHRRTYRTPQTYRASRLVEQSDLPSRGFVGFIGSILLVLAVLAGIFGIRVVPDDPPVAVPVAVVADVPPGACAVTS